MTDLISQGTYGCIFKPGFTCKGKPTQSKKYITKIQKREDTSSKETNIGEIIKKIDDYEDFFAPILKTCEISLAQIEDNSVTRCNFIEENNKKKYESNKLRYVGENTISKYILDVVDNNANSLIRVLIESHKNLLVGFNKLFSAGIVHLDVKENNIMIDDNTKNPIIIDFGLSSEINSLSDNKYRDVFFVYGPDYEPWCIDICMITYMANELKDQKNPYDGMLGFIGFEENKTKNWMEWMVTKENITKVINDFIKKNTAIIHFFNEKKRNEYSKKLHDYFNSFIGKTWKELAENLILNLPSWDCYAVSIIYLRILHDIDLQTVDISLSSWNSYKQTLENMILSQPDKRMNCNDMIKTLDDLFKNISSSENIKLKTMLNNVSKNKKNKMNIRKNVLTSIQNNLHNEQNVYQAMRNKTI